MAQNKKINFVPLIILLILVAFLLSYGKFLQKNYYQKSPSVTTSLSGVPSSIPATTSCGPNKFSSSEIENSLHLGKVTAPIVMEVFSDYQCPWCSRYWLDTLKQVLPDYINQGKVCLIYRELAFEGERSQWGAEAAYCANEQGKFWEFHDKVVTERFNSNTTDILEQDNLKKLAEALGLDTQKFNNCLDSRKYQELVTQITQQALQQGVNGIPTTFLNGIRVTNDQGEPVGAMPPEMLKSKIDECLSQLKI